MSGHGHFPVYLLHALLCFAAIHCAHFAAPQVAGLPAGVQELRTGSACDRAGGSPKVSACVSVRDGLGSPKVSACVSVRDGLVTL
jgi:hypothetical protein